MLQLTSALNGRYLLGAKRSVGGPSNQRASPLHSLKKAEVLVLPPPLTPSERKGAPLAIWAGSCWTAYRNRCRVRSACGSKGMARRNILLIWISIMLFAGIGAAVGSIFIMEASASMYALIEGIAVGAMPTMIEKTTLPEAYFKGGWWWVCRRWRDSKSRYLRKHLSDTQ